MKGNRANPTGAGGGRPLGSVSLTTRIKEALAADDDRKAKIFADALILQACKGNGTAIKAILDRVDGPVTQKLEAEISPDSRVFFESLQELAKTTRDAILQNQAVQDASERTLRVSSDENDH